MATKETLPNHIFGEHLFGVLKPEQREVIKNAALTTAFEDGELIYTKGAAATFLYIVLEGEVALRLPGSEGVSILIEQLGQSEMFGLNATFDLGSYGVQAQAIGFTKVIKIETAVLQRIMDEDNQVGYAIQRRISQLYYKRYVATARRLQAIVTAIPLQAARPRESRWIVD